MKLLILFLTFIVTFSASADINQCKSNVVVYNMEGKGYFYICHDKKEVISFSAKSFGDKLYSCGMRGKAKLHNKVFIYKKWDCEVKLSLQNNKLIAEFGDCWRGFCGMQANWHDGEYIKK